MYNNNNENDNNYRLEFGLEHVNVLPQHVSSARRSSSALAAKRSCMHKQ
jgi:hypothetical protein